MTDSLSSAGFSPPARWLASDGTLVSCAEKIRVLNENLDELAQMAQDVLEDAILMGVDEAQIRAVLARLVTSLRNPYS